MDLYQEEANEPHKMSDVSLKIVQLASDCKCASIQMQRDK